MTNPEFSTEFDVLYNNISSNQAPALDDYEKSVFLTRAQYDVLSAYFNLKDNKNQEGYDGSIRRQVDFTNLTETFSIGEDGFDNPIYDFHSNTKSAQLIDDQNESLEIMGILNERLQVTRDEEQVVLQVIPIAFDEYQKLTSKAYKRPLKGQAWRLITNQGYDLIPGPSDTIVKYEIRYVRKPCPIILTELEDITINGLSTETECEVDSILHPDILQRAVELAKASYIGNIEGTTTLSSQIAIGNNSATNIGMLTTNDKRQ